MMYIRKFRPDEDSLHKYFYDALNAGFGFSGDIADYIIKHFPDANGSFGHEEITRILSACGKMPEYHYFVTDSEERRLSSKHFFTRVAQINAEDGLVVFEAFMSQIYYLLNDEGSILLGPCHDLDLGQDGLIMFRESGGDPVFQMIKKDDPDYHRTGGAEPFDDFPYIRGL